MKTENSKETSTSAKTQVRIKTLKLSKETIETLSATDSGAVKGGGRSGISG